MGRRSRWSELAAAEPISSTRNREWVSKEDEELLGVSGVPGGVTKVEETRMGGRIELPSGEDPSETHEIEAL